MKYIKKFNEKISEEAQEIQDIDDLDQFLDRMKKEREERKDFVYQIAKEMEGFLVSITDEIDDLPVKVNVEKGEAPYYLWQIRVTINDWSTTKGVMWGDIKDDILNLINSFKDVFRLVIISKDDGTFSNDYPPRQRLYDFSEKIKDDTQFALLIFTFEEII